MRAVYFLRIVCSLAGLLGCSNQEKLGVVQVSETAGFDRSLEYVSVGFPVGIDMQFPSDVMARDSETGKTTVVQMLPHKSGKDSINLMFPVEIKANQNKSYDIVPLDESQDITTPNFKFSEDNPSIENELFKATFSTEDDKRGGQLDGILLKNFDNQLLKRGHIAMHWAPNFSKSDSEGYFNFEDLPSDAENSTKIYRYHLERSRSGITDSVPEIGLSGRYSFFDGLPYFLFESTITMVDDVELNLLRNDEMTMDSLFTHVVYRGSNGSIEHLALYEDEIDSLDTDPIPDDADYVAFYHNEKGYGFGSIRLEYDNENLDGTSSPLTAPHTKISKSRNNGRYWNRVLSDTVQYFPNGGRYHEKNAYLIFDAGGESPEAELERYFQILQKPLETQVSVANSVFSN